MAWRLDGARFARLKRIGCSRIKLVTADLASNGWKGAGGMGAARAGGVAVDAVDDVRRARRMDPIGRLLANSHDIFARMGFPGRYLQLVVRQLQTLM